MRRFLSLHPSLVPFASAACVSLCIGSLGAISGAAENQPPSSESVLHHLNTVIPWYHATKEVIQPVGEATDQIYAINLEAQALQVTQLAFASAKAQAVLQTDQPDNAGAEQGGFANPQNLQKIQKQLQERNAGLQSQIASLDPKIDAASGKAKASLTAQHDRLQGELDLGNTMLKSVTQMAVFVNQNGESSGAGGLLGSINQLQRSVPEIVATGKTAAAPQPVAMKSLSATSGLIGEAGMLYQEGITLGAIRKLQAQTQEAEAAAQSLRDPLRQMLRATLQQGQALSALANAPPAPTTKSSPPPPPAPTKADFDAISQQFSRIAAAQLPLSQEIIVLDEAKANLSEWREAVGREYSRLLRSLLSRIITIAIVLGVIALLSELWKRMTFRYVKDYRRRRQFLLMRRFVIGFLMGLVIILGFVSEFSSLATFAGFITAGLAVGLQTILLSVAAYFFLIGRYGIRVGDRVSISGVTGDVIDVGLVRLYIMELSGTGIDLYPTGRLVVFSNAVLFQATTPLFKQIPGTEYAWHEVAIGIAPGANAKAVEDKLLAVVSNIFESYRGELERQHGDIEKRVEVHIRAPKPQSLLQFSDTGLEAIVRYPISLTHLSEIDDQVTRELVDLLDKDVDLKAGVSSMPKIRAAVKQ